VGDANEILSHLLKQDENKMIAEGLFKNNYETFWEINQSHLLRPIADFKRFAIRVFTNMHHTYVQLDQRIKDKPISEQGENVSESDPQFKTWEQQELQVTIGEVLMNQFPALFTQNMDDGKIEPSRPEMEVLSQGVPVDLSSCVYWLQLNLSYPDGFMYLSFHFKGH
jgi:Autophagy protein Apg5